MNIIVYIRHNCMPSTLNMGLTVPNMTGQSQSARYKYMHGHVPIEAGSQEKLR